jgi:hypothetical protein
MVRRALEHRWRPGGAACRSGPVCRQPRDSIRPRRCSIIRNDAGGGRTRTLAERGQPPAHPTWLARFLDVLGTRIEH